MTREPKTEKLDAPITVERVQALKRMNICGPAAAWLSEEGRTHADLAEHPEWAFLSAKYYGGELAVMQAIVIAHGSPELRRKFATYVPGANVMALLDGL